MTRIRPVIVAACTEAGLKPMPASLLRPIVWFTAASILTTALHELTHAYVASAVGVSSTLFSRYVNLNLAPTDAAIPQRALIGVSGPLLCLALGAIAWFSLRRTRGSAAELPLLYFTAFGIGTFFGNMMSASFVGDFSSVARLLGFPMGARYVITSIGLLSVAAIQFWVGRELVRLVPARIGKVRATFGIIVVPVVAGTVVVILASQPMSGSTTSSVIAEAGLWLFAALGALTTRRDGEKTGPELALRWADGAVLILALLIVRVTVPGIAFTP